MEVIKDKFIIIKKDNGFTDNKQYNSYEQAQSFCHDDEMPISLYNYNTQNRFFQIHQNVCYYDPNVLDRIDAEIMFIDGYVSNSWVDEETLVGLLFTDLSVKIVKASAIYAYDMAMTKANDEYICFEHMDDIDYPYYMPSADENYYAVELKEPTKIC